MRYSVLHLKSNNKVNGNSETALKMADHLKKTVAKLLRGMMVLPKEGKKVGEGKAATKGGKT